MISLSISIGILIIGYIVYGTVVSKVFGPDERMTPAYSKTDNVDYVPLKTWRAWLVQLLNIAGTGPIFGALMGAVFGPIVFIWIVLGCILAGGVHDYFTGMISCRNAGVSIAELSGTYLNKVIKWVMRIFSVILLILVGAVFVESPAALLAMLTPEHMDTNFWVIIIIIYYFFATIWSVDKLIGKLYPLFGAVLILGAVLIIMTLGIFGTMLFPSDRVIPEFTLQNLHPDGLSPWPFMFITVACGAISGFHSTQSPIVAKCMRTEKDGRKIFYGSMIAEGVIALAWAAAGMTFYGDTASLQNALNTLGQSGTVYEISIGMMGMVGGIMAIFGVIACPITSGDTAFRSARLVIAETFHIKQGPIRNRLLIAIPVIGIGAILTQLNFDVLWRYFSWANQTLAMLGLCVAASYIVKNSKNMWYSLIAAVPGVFMAAVTSTYILLADEGFRLPEQVAYPLGILFACVMLGWYILLLVRKSRADKKGINTADPLPPKDERSNTTYEKEVAEAKQKRKDTFDKFKSIFKK